jgi:hypothetical protein
MTTDVIKQISQWVSDCLIKDPREFNLLNNFIKGNCGIAVTNAFGLKATGYFADMNPNDIGFTTIPAYNKDTKSYTTGLFRGWGLVRGAKNPVAAGIFLRYYLDVNNYNTTTAFISEEAESFFFKLNSTSTENKNFYFCYGSGVTGVTGKESAVGDYIQKPATADPTQVVTVVSSYQNEINADINKLNEKLK